VRGSSCNKIKSFPVLVQICDPPDLKVFRSEKKTAEKEGGGKKLENKRKKEPTTSRVASKAKEKRG
jgi:hypothetical protein